jgi:hypothetical protein
MMLAFEGPQPADAGDERDHPRNGDQRQGANEREGRGPEVERHVVLRCAADCEHDRGSRRDEGGEEKWVGSLELTGGVMARLFASGAPTFVAMWPA